MADVADMTGRLRDLRKNMSGEVYALIAGYPASCFARLLEDGLDLPPGCLELENKTKPFELSWPLFSDIRVFNEIEEWHFWRDDDGWHERPCVFGKLDPEESIDYHDPILGRRLGKSYGNWVERTENRGPTVWVPAAFGGDKKKRPVLRVVQIMRENVHEGPGEKVVQTGLFGIADAAIRGFDLVDGAVVEEGFEEGMENG